MEPYINLKKYPVREVLPILLEDKTTKKNILWATKDYESLGEGYEERSEILSGMITAGYASLIQPRSAKAREDQTSRTRNKAEVFTPSWVCNAQNNLIDEEWFGRKDVFNTETDGGWITKDDPVIFPEHRSWKKYVDVRRMEVTCGEAPYLVSRYDTVTGDPIKPHDRIGLLDRKLRVVEENASTDEEWLKWSIRAVQSVYGYEYQGDSLFLARENLLLSYIDYYKEHFLTAPDKPLLKKVANIIAWNIWQMNGVTMTAPFSRKEPEYKQETLFTMYGVGNDADQEIPEEIPCRIMDWRDKSSTLFGALLKGEH